MAEDIHEGVQRYRLSLERLDKSVKIKYISVRDRNLIQKFVSERSLQGISTLTLEKNISNLIRIANLLPVNIDRAGKAHLMNVIMQLQNSNIVKRTVDDYKLVMRQFYRWLEKSDKSPERVAWIKIPGGIVCKMPEQLLTEDDIIKMVKATDDLMMKSFILLLYDSGARIGEILPLKMKHIEFVKHGAKIMVDGKTGQRRILLVPSARVLASWINTKHPDPDNPEAYVWAGKSYQRGYVSYGCLRLLLKEIAKCAGINKRVYPHLFRHTRATYYANYLTEAQMKQHFGWTQASEMAAVYVHLSGRDVDDALYRHYGIKEDPRHKPVDFAGFADMIAIEEKMPTGKAIK